MSKIKITPDALNDIEILCTEAGKDNGAFAEYIFAAIEEMERDEVLSGDRCLNKYVVRQTDYYYHIVAKVCLIFYRKQSECVEIVRVLKLTEKYIKHLTLARRELPDAN